MGAIKRISDDTIIDNERELITPAIVRAVNDVIDTEVEATKTSITTIEQNITTLTSRSIPTGGLEGQILAKRSNVDSDVEWIAPPSGSVSFPTGGTTGQILAKSSDNDGEVHWISPPTGYLPLSGGTVTGDIDMNFQTLSVSKIHYSKNSITKELNFVQNTISLNGSPLKYYQRDNLSILPVITSDWELTHKGYVDNAISTSISNIPTTDVSGLLPKSGGTMTGNLRMDGTAQIFVNKIEAQNSNQFDIQNASFNNEDNEAITYVSEPTLNNPNDIPHKSYVDAIVTKITKKSLPSFPSQGSVITINHEFSDDNVQVEIWVQFQDGTLNVQQGYRKLVFEDTKIHIVKTNENQVKIDVLGDYTNDQTLGAVEILVYSYPKAIVNELTNA